MDHYTRGQGGEFDFQHHIVAPRRNGRHVPTIRRRRMRKEPKWLKRVILHMMGIVVCSTFLSLLFIHGLARGAKHRKTNKWPGSREVADIFPINISYIYEPTLGTNYDNKACGNFDASWSMVFFVKSQASNFQRRELLRRTWASLSRVGNANFTTVFVVGEAKAGNSQMSLGSLNNLLREEKDRYRDILHYRGPDDYTNIGFKTLTGMHWASENLPDNFFYATADDDFMLNLGELHDVIEVYKANGADPFPIICGFGMFENAPPLRDPQSKWYVNEEEYSNDTYPKFCLGGMYTMPVSLVRRLWAVGKFRRPMRVDDVWITGILREEIGLPASLVVKPSSKIAEHLDNYKNIPFHGIRLYMRAQWIEIYKLFRHKPMCVRPYVYFPASRSNKTGTMAAAQSVKSPNVELN